MSWILDFDLSAARQMTKAEALSEYGSSASVYAPMGTSTQPLAVDGPYGQAVILFRSVEELERYSITLPRPLPTDDVGEFTLGQVLGVFDAALLMELDGVNWTYTHICD